MAINFPPIPVYPKNYDNDYTLFLVFNTTESITTLDNQAWSEEISIKPVNSDDLEIWGENGFANIDGELFYYDSVGKDEYGKINKLKKCIRNLGNKKTKFNKAGSEVRGYVVAEHHNQLVDAIINMESFIGQNFDENQATLDWRIRNLQNTESIFDDFTCPDVTFIFSVNEESPTTGFVATYEILIDGVYNGYKLDFGDGNSTTTSTSGTHRYAPSAKIDPVVTVSTEKCTIVQTPISRSEAGQPQIQTDTQALEIKIPEIPELPPIVIPVLPTPSLTIQPPPLVPPCINLGPLGNINVPSVITFDPPINIPSEVRFGDVPMIPNLINFGSFPSIPSTIEFGSLPTVPVVIEFGTVPSFPSLINFGPVPSIPTTINFGPVPIFPNTINFGAFPIFPTTIVFADIPNFPTTIAFGPAPTFPSTITFGPAPTFPSTITFGPAPTIPDIKFDPPPSIPDIKFDPPPSIPDIMFDTPPTIPNIMFDTPPTIPEILFGSPPEFPLVEFGSPPVVTVEWGTPPSCSCTVQIACPTTTPLAARFNALDYEDPNIEVNMGDLGIPSVIKVLAPEIPDIRILHDIPAKIIVESLNIPKSINLNSDIPKEIKVINQDIPSTIELVATNLPKSIPLDTSSLPKSIMVEPSPDFPKTIKLDLQVPDLKVVGIPESIKLVGPSEIKVTFDKPEIEMVYKGPPLTVAPIDVKVQLDVSRLTGEGDQKQCFSLVPC